MTLARETPTRSRSFSSEDMKKSGIKSPGELQPSSKYVSWSSTRGWRGWGGGGVGGCMEPLCARVFHLINLIGGGGGGVVWLGEGCLYAR